MIDGVGKTGAGRIEMVRTPVERSAPIAPSGDAMTRPDAGAPASIVANLLSSGPPINAGRVAELKAAIAEERYPIDADRIAERMIALDLPSGREA